MNSNSLPNEFNPTIMAPNYFIRKGILSSVIRLAPKLNGRLMDFGCGAKPYQSLFNVEKYTGVDYNSEGHSHTDEQIDVFYDGQHLPFSNNTFDSIFTSEVLEHIFNLNEIVPELNRVLKTGGHILITCPYAICEHEAPNDFARYTSYGLTSILEKTGFEIIEFEKSGTSVTTVFQLWLTYIHQHINPLFKKIPVIRSVFRFITYTTLNIFGIICNQLLPKSTDLYLNNIVLAKKIRDIS
jgi:SAM-dependent methyltransferase